MDCWNQYSELFGAGTASRITPHPVEACEAKANGQCWDSVFEIRYPWIKREPDSVGPTFPGEHIVGSCTTQPYRKLWWSNASQDEDCVCVALVRHFKNNMKPKKIDASCTYNELILQIICDCRVSSRTTKVSTSSKSFAHRRLFVFNCMTSLRCSGKSRKKIDTGEEIDGDRDHIACANAQPTYCAGSSRVILL